MYRAPNTDDFLRSKECIYILLQKYVFANFFALPVYHFSISKRDKLTTYLQKTVPVTVILSENPVLPVVSVPLYLGLIGFLGKSVTGNLSSG